MRYFITFACYGGHLHGDESGSVDRNHNLPGGRLLEADPDRVAAERQSMTQAQYLLDRDSRAVVLQALLAGCGKTPKPLVNTRGSEIGTTCLQQLTELRPSGSGTAEPFPQPARTVAANTA